MAEQQETETESRAAKAWSERWPFSLLFESTLTDAETQRTLADQFRRSLLSDLKAIPQPADDTPQLRLIYNEANVLLADAEAYWPEIYQAQKHLAHLVPDEALDAALEREIAEAAGMALDTSRVVERVHASGADAATIPEKRKYLSMLVSDLQWERKQKTARSEMRACYVWNVCLLTIPVAVFALLALAWPVWANYEEHPLLGKFGEYFRYPGLFTIVAFGILGAWFSMLRTVDTRLSGLTLSELRVLQRWTSLMARLIFGGAAATIFYFLLQSGLFTATILPDISQIGFQPKPVDPAAAEASLRERVLSGEISSGDDDWLPSADLCLLIIWGVICGFSEKLIPSALTRHADTVNGEAGNANGG